MWKRFAETPERYPGIADQLRKARPEELIVENLDAWPQDNEMAEDQLRNLLRDFEALTPEGARKEAARLDAEHAWRRGTVWADLDLAPLAFALEQLVALAELTAQPLASSDLASLTADYAERGWRADDALLRALAAAKSSIDRAAVSAAAVAMYGSWLDAGAKALQAAIGPMANANTYAPGPPAATDGHGHRVRRRPAPRRRPPRAGAADRRGSWTSTPLRVSLRCRRSPRPRSRRSSPSPRAP